MLTKKTLINELVRLFIDNEGISNKDEQNDYSHTGIEALVNRVTAEILVPKLLFERENTLNIEELASKYRVSRYVIARRLLDSGKINKTQYNNIILLMESEAPSQRQSTGGNYSNNIRFRIDKTFFHFARSGLIYRSISSNRHRI